MDIIKGNKKDIFSWATDLEDGALEQAKNLANLPFVHNHIALMPDCHQGFGMPIGGVMATRDVVIPNAVGVDIGCFEGKTLIPLLDGTKKTLKELSKRKNSFYVYSLDKNNQIVPGKAIALKTRKNAKVMQVSVSGGDIITCTPDHKFMLIDGNYKEAKDLKPMDSLMPLYRTYETKDGYESIMSYHQKAIKTHKMVAKHCIGGIINNRVIHHINKKWYDNSPENLMVLTQSAHSKLHREINNYFKTSGFQEKRLNTLKEKGFYNKKYKRKKQIIAIENIKKFNDSDAKRELDKTAGLRGKKYIIKNNKDYYECEICGKTCKGLGALGRHKKIHKNNHKVLWTKSVDKKIDVYCLQVDKYHNFALDAGIFVHNCGMHAVKTNIKKDELTKEKLIEIMSHIRENIPVGFNHRKESVDKNKMPKNPDSNILNVPEFISSKEYESARKQMGTLGGGNHFIEIQYDQDNIIWFMIHSGSRNIGLKVAKHYNDLAIELNSKYHSIVKKEKDLAFLPIDSEEAKDYLSEMEYCLEFAKLNRQYMADIIKEKMGEAVEEYDVHHNYVTKEKHFGREVWVHRKGATSAKEGEIGIIPGSQGTSSYIVKGKGNYLSFNSCSHGAGRKIGRREAQRQLNLEEEKKKLDDQGIMHSIRNEKDLDEASGAYKDIQEVMKNQEDLVEIVTELKPIAVVKG